MHSLVAVYVGVTHRLLDWDMRTLLSRAFFLRRELWGADWFGSLKGAVGRDGMGMED